jgi:phosphatidylserine/phosphatidylglycerophosphate/cardiolipin synthase-like enzyme
VLYALLSFALGATAPIQPAASITTRVSIATCFAPEENCSAFAVDAINGAEREILVGAYSLTVGSGIPEALARAAKRAVDVRVIADKTTPCDPHLRPNTENFIEFRTLRRLKAAKKDF